jgi:hypothetical protein
MHKDTRKQPHSDKKVSYITILLIKLLQKIVLSDNKLNKSDFLRKFAIQIENNKESI